MLVGLLLAMPVSNCNTRGLGLGSGFGLGCGLLCAVTLSWKIRATLVDSLPLFLARARGIL